MLYRKPENLQVVWLRGHRRIDSPTVKWVPKTESGEGRATFDPPIAASLLVTLYQGKVNILNIMTTMAEFCLFVIHQEQQEYEQKEYKFYIENVSTIILQIDNIFTFRRERMERKF